MILRRWDGLSQPIAPLRRTTDHQRRCAGMTVPPPVTFLVFGDDWGRHVSSLQHLFAQLTTRTR